MANRKQPTPPPDAGQKPQPPPKLPERKRTAAEFIRELLRVGQWYRPAIELDQYVEGFTDGEDLQREAEEIVLSEATQRVNEDLEDDYVQGGDTYELVNRMSGTVPVPPLPRCSCGHDRSDHWSSGDPVPMCTRCVCSRYTPEHSDYQCPHHWYTYRKDGAPDHDMCLLCCETRGGSAAVEPPAKPQHGNPAGCYIGDSKIVSLQGDPRGAYLVLITQEHSDGRRTEVRMDPLVLGEFVDWMQDQGILGTRVRGDFERVPVNPDAQETP